MSASSSSVSSVSGRVRTIVSQMFGIPAAQVTEATGAENVEAWDSIHQIHLLVALEAEFGVSFDPEGALALTSVSSLVGALTAMGIAA